MKLFRSQAIIHTAAPQQLPPRLQIPGALLTQVKPVPYRQPRIQQSDGAPPRLRRPNPSPPPALIRPVVEETEEVPNSSSNPSPFDEEASRLGLSVLQSAVRQADNNEEPLRPLPFRPERPVPVTRQDVRDNLTPQRERIAPAHHTTVRPLEYREPRPIARQEIREENNYQVQRHPQQQVRQQVQVILVEMFHS